MDEVHRTAVEHEAPGPEPAAALTTTEDAQGNAIVLRYSERELLDDYRAGTAAAGVEHDRRVVEVLERLGRMRRGMLDDEAERVAKLDELMQPGVTRIGRAMRALAPLAGTAEALRTDPPTEEELAERRDPTVLLERVTEQLANALDDALDVDAEDPHALVRASTRVRQYADATASLAGMLPPPAAPTPAPELDVVLQEVWNEVQSIDFPVTADAGEPTWRMSTADADLLIGRLRARLG